MGMAAITTKRVNPVIVAAKKQCSFSLFLGLFLIISAKIRTETGIVIKPKKEKISLNKYIRGFI